MTTDVTESAQEAQEEAQPSPVSFGKLSPQEAGRLGAAERERRRREREEGLALAAGSTQPDPGVENIRRIAQSGKGYQAVQAQRYLDELALRSVNQAHSEALLSLLTPAQRACIEAYLKGEAVSQALAVEAWCGESPAQEDIRTGT